MKTGHPPPSETKEVLAALVDKLVEIARADDSANAARACEAIGSIGMLQAVMGRRTSHPELTRAWTD